MNSGRRKESEVGVGVEGELELQVNVICVEFYREFKSKANNNHCMLRDSNLRIWIYDIYLFKSIFSEMKRADVAQFEPKLNFKRLC